MSELRRICVGIDCNSNQRIFDASVEINRDDNVLKGAAVADNSIEAVKQAIFKAFSKIDLSKADVFYTIVLECSLPMVGVVLRLWQSDAIEQFEEDKDIFIAFAKALIKAIDLYKAQE